MHGKLVADSRQVVKDAREIAAALGAPTLEAEHLLLGLAHRPGTTAQQVLSEAGLDYDRVGAALGAEFEGCLAAVGVSLADFDLPAPRESTRIPRWGTSAKLALQRSAKIAHTRRDRRITPGHLLLGILGSTVGTVARALDRSGIDREELSRRVAARL